MNEINPCSYCGSDVSLSIEGNPVDLPHVRWWVFQCSNVDCWFWLMLLDSAAHPCSKEEAISSYNASSERNKTTNDGKLPG